MHPEAASHKMPHFDTMPLTPSGCQSHIPKSPVKDAGTDE
jgi:hypothetical protein